MTHLFHLVIIFCFNLQGSRKETNHLRNYFRIVGIYSSYSTTTAFQFVLCLPKLITPKHHITLKNIIRHTEGMYFAAKLADFLFLILQFQNVGTSRQICFLL